MIAHLSLVNLIRTATVTASSNSGSGQFGSDNVKTSERPAKRWHSSNTATSWIHIDFGSPVTLDVFDLNSANFAFARIQGRASSSGGNDALWTSSPTFDRPIEITRHPFTTRFSKPRLTPGFTFQFARILIPAQATLVERDGVSPSSFFALGGLWGGTIEPLPRSWRWSYTWGTSYPRKKVGPGHWSRTVRLGAPYTSLRGTLELFTNFDAPGINDQLGLWQDLQRRMNDRGPFLAVCEYLGGLYSLVAEDESDPAEIDYPVASVPLLWTEAL